MVKEIIVSKPQQFILNSFAERNLMMCGVGMGKSHIAGILGAEFAINYPESRGFIGANSYGQLAKSTLDRVFKVWGDVFNWHYGNQYVVDRVPPASFKIVGERLKSYENTISFNNGSLIFTSSLEKYKLIDGTEFAWAILDETKDTREEAVKEVIIARLRHKSIWRKGRVLYDLPTHEAKIKSGAWAYIEDVLYDLDDLEVITNFNPLYILTSPAKVTWLNEWFDIPDQYAEIRKKIYSKTDYYHKEENDKCLVIASTYHNERNLPPGYIERLQKDFVGQQNRVNMLIYGDPIGKTGGEWFATFDRLKHVKKLRVEPELPFHVMFDFNVVPYMTMLVAQIAFRQEGTKRIMSIRFLSEHCLPSPHNKTASCCREYLKHYGKYNKMLYYYGDSSGKARNTVAEDIEHNYQVVEQILIKHVVDASDRVARRNPSLVKSRDFINKLHGGGFDFIEVFYDESMKNTIEDMEVLKEDINGGYKPAKEKDSETKVSYEPHGHCADAQRYFLCAALEDLYEELND